MRKFIPVFLLMFVLTTSCQDNSKQPGDTAKNFDDSNGMVKKVDSTSTKLDRFSYAIGIDMGKSLMSKYITVDYDALLQGIMDGMKTTDQWQMTEDEYALTVQQFQTEQQVKYDAKRKQISEENLASVKEFTDENRSKDGIIELPNGLQYRIIKSGTGPSPSTTDVVNVHYTGRLINGYVFDSSIKRGQPYRTAVNQVIPGWTEILQKMKVGDKWEVFIPPALAYGERGSGSKIGPNEMLIFEMELLSIEGK